jgi:hypothetical protein
MFIITRFAIAANRTQKAALVAVPFCARVKAF